MYRTTFRKEIVAEFLPPARNIERQRLILLCDGMPSVPSKQPLAQFLSRKGYWVIYPRWRGAWESGGRFLEKSPAKDLSDIIDELPKRIREAAFGKTFALSPDKIFVIGGSFGGTAAILSSLDPRVTKVIANCPVVDWSILPKEQKQRNLESELRRIHPRSLWQWLPTLQEELGEVKQRHLLQSSTPRSRTHGVKDPDVSREG